MCLQGRKYSLLHLEVQLLYHGVNDSVDGYMNCYSIATSTVHALQFVYILYAFVNSYQITKLACVAIAN